MNQLLAATNAWILDVIFFVLLLGGTLIGVKRGFLKGICKITGTIFSVVVAQLFCIAFQNTLEKWFGLTTALTEAIKIPLLAYWIANIISFIILVVFVKLSSWLIGIIGTALVDRSNGLKRVNMALGGLLGMFKSFLVIFFLLAFFTWINVSAVNNFISSSVVVGALYDSRWFRAAVQLTAHAITRK